MSDIVSPVTDELGFAQGMEFVKRFMEAGMTVAEMKVVAGGNTRARRMTVYNRIGQESSDERLVRRIMDDSYFGREEWGDIYDVSLNAQQSRKIAVLPWSEELLDSECLAAPGKSVAEACFAFLGVDRYNGRNMPDGMRTLPLSIMSWQQIHPADEKPRFYSYGTNCWYPNEQFAAVPLELKWYLGLKEIVQGSPNTSWDGMQPMVYDGYRVPSPIEELTKDFLYYQKFKAYPNKNHYAVTDTLYSSGFRVIVGYCNDGTVNVPYWDGSAYDYVGLGLFRK